MAGSERTPALYFVPLIHEALTMLHTNSAERDGFAGERSERSSVRLAFGRLSCRPAARLFVCVAALKVHWVKLIKEARLTALLMSRLLSAGLPSIPGWLVERSLLDAHSDMYENGWKTEITFIVLQHFNACICR